MSEERLAIIVPYRNRRMHLRMFGPHMKQRLPKADIFIIEQNGNEPFNRGKLLNVGFLYAKDYDYYCFHDIDMLPIKSDYSYPIGPTLLATQASQFKFKMPFPEYFGGVILFRRHDYIQCNGHSNLFIGWGGEDNELYDHITKRCGMKIYYRQCMYNSLHHTRKVDTEQYQNNLAKWRAGRQEEDGLTHCVYSIVSEYQFKEYKVITVDI